MEFKGKKVLIFGLGRSGLAAARALKALGAQVTLTDRSDEAALGSKVVSARQEGLALALGGHPLELLEGLALIVLSPGVPGTIPVLLKARELKVPIWSEIELAYVLAKHRWLAVTGTNGKTTTTSLLAAMADADGGPYLCGGNIGKALADAVQDLPAAGLVIAEVSSFQLEEIHEFRPQVAVLCNLTPDHLDRYKDMAAYAAAKARIFENQGADDFAVVNALDPASLELTRNLKAQKLLFDRSKPVERGAWIEKGEIKVDLGAGPKNLLPLSKLRLRGPHNQENALAAAAAAAAAGMKLGSIASALESFAGVEHRLEPSGELDGIRFVNDSKATNVDSVEKALQSFAEPVHLILGGRDKQGDFKKLAALIKDHVAAIYLIGEATEVIEKQLQGLKPMQRLKSMEEAVSSAFKAAKKGEWVLLSPGCASFDMFDNYEHRGRVFKQAVAKLGAQVGGKA
jgi:UDP-N-acetylmuramoylalanine--D-glutamate ligase